MFFPRFGALREMQPPLSPPLSQHSASPSRPPSRSEKVDVKALLVGAFSHGGPTARAGADEARKSMVYAFRVRKPRKKTESLEKEVLYKKRIITVDLGDGVVRYGSSPTQGRIFPGPDRLLRVSIALDFDTVLDFVFPNLAWKGKTQLRLFFRSVRERDIFFDLYTALPVGGTADEVADGRGTVDVALRGSMELPAAKTTPDIVPGQAKASGDSGALPIMTQSPMLVRRQRSMSYRRENVPPATASDKFSVYCATWNMGNEAAPSDLTQWLKPGFDVYAVAAQETTLSKKQQETELKMQKQSEAVSRGEVLLKEMTSIEMANSAAAVAATASAAAGSGGTGNGNSIAGASTTVAGVEAIGARDAKILKKKASEAIRAATVQELQEKDDEKTRAKREYERLHKEAHALYKEAKKDKSKTEQAAVRKQEAEAARAYYNTLKEALYSRKKELHHMARHVKVDYAATVIDLGEKPTKKDTHFVNRIRAHIAGLEGEYVEVAYSVLWSMRLVVFVRRSLAAQVSCVEADQVTCGGPGGKYGNKGCCAVNMFVGNTNLLFVGAHLAAHLDKNALRNQNFHTIMSKLSLGMRDWPVSCKFDHVFFFGDLNYRLELGEEAVASYLRSGTVTPLFEADQLTNARRDELAFAGFDEDIPTFFPTFKLVKNALLSGGQAALPAEHEGKEFGTLAVQSPDGTQLSYYLERVPSYCDRILVKSAKHAKHRLRRTEYDAVYSFSSSDHLPVYSAFVCGVDWRRPLLDLATLERSEPVPPCFILLTGLALRLRGEDAGHDFSLSCFGPTFLNASLFECGVPSRSWDAPASRAHFLGALGLTCRTGNVEHVRLQRVYVRAASTTARVFGILRMEAAFSAARGAGGVPFEVELFSKSSPASVGILSGVMCGFP